MDVGCLVLGNGGGMKAERCGDCLFVLSPPHQMFSLMRVVPTLTWQVLQSYNPLSCHFGWSPACAKDDQPVAILLPILGYDVAHVLQRRMGHGVAVYLLIICTTGGSSSCRCLQRRSSTLPHIVCCFSLVVLCICWVALKRQG